VADDLDPDVSALRRRMMRAVRRRDTAPEMKVRSVLHARGYRYRVHVRGLPGTPDIVFSRRRVVIFVHGCFWHRHGCHLTTTPRTRAEFWSAKFRRNQERDRATASQLRSLGWTVVEVWECETRNGEFLDPLLTALGSGPSGHR